MDVKLWWFALQKPVKENDKRVWDSFDVVAKWLISTRATVTQLTLMAGVISGLLAYRAGYFDFLPWLLMTRLASYQPGGSSGSSSASRLRPGPSACAEDISSAPLR